MVVYYKSKLGVLFQGDCIEVMRMIPDGVVDTIICDLPYGWICMTSAAWDVLILFDKLWEQYNRVTKPTSNIVLFGSQPFTTQIINSNLKNFRYELIWDKQFSSQFGLAKIQPMKSHENICVFFKKRGTYNPQMTEGKPYTVKNAPKERPKDTNELGYGMKGGFTIINEGTRYPKSIIPFQKYNKSGQHPTEKPLPLLEWLVKTYSNPRDLILDNTCGGGSTLLAAHLNNRRYIGIEMTDKYCEMTKNKLQNVDEASPV